MNLREGLVAVLNALRELKIPFMVVGSFSSNVYGIPRSTQDADIVVQLAQGDLGRLAGHLGAEFKLVEQMTFEAVTGTMRHRLYAGRAVTFELFLLSDDPHDQARWTRRVRVPLAGAEAWIPSAEDVIIMKLRWSHQGGRSKDIEDVRGVMIVQRDRLDWSYIEGWCDRHGTRRLLEQVRASIPPA